MNPIGNPRKVRFVPLSAAQERLWLLEQLAPGNPVYHLSGAWRLTGPLQPSALEKALAEVVRRQAMLRSIFQNDSGRPSQVAETPPRFHMNIADLRSIPVAERDKEVHRLGLEQFRKPFDLTRDLLLRAALVGLDDTNHILLITTHQLACDAPSLKLVLRETASLYEAVLSGRPSSLPALSTSYADFAVHQQEWLMSNAARQELAFWKQRLDGMPFLFEFPMGHPRPVEPSFRGSRQEFSLGIPTTEALRSFSRKQGCSLETTLLAVFQVLASRYTSREDLVIGVPVSNAANFGEGNLFGNFSNTLVVRTNSNGDPSFHEFLRRVSVAFGDAQAHAHFPFEKLIEELNLPRDGSYHPLFQARFIFDREPWPTSRADGLAFESMDLDSQVSQTDLSLVVRETERGLEGRIEYAADLFDSDAIRRMVGHFESLLLGILENPAQRISQLPLLTKPERRQLLSDWNNTQMEIPPDQCLHHLVEAQAERSPESIALIYGGEQLTYRDLNRRANQLAHKLQSLGANPEGLVGICTERSINMIVAMLAVLKAGGAYVPLDPAYPPDRLAFILDDAKVAVLLTQESLSKSLPEHGAKTIFLDNPALWAEKSGDKRSLENPSSAVTPKNLAYVIYTSGSTGRPKGVAIEHHSPVTFVHWAKSVFFPEELAGVLASTSICFDLSIFEIFVPLSAGGKIILAENALQLPELAAAWQVTLINTVPSAIAELVRAGAIPPSVKAVNLAGEPLETKLVNQIYEQSAVTKVYDLYGPSEDTTYSTFAHRRKEAPATIGRPIANTHVYLLDEHLQLVPVGLPGELHLSGDGLARGYLNRPELTAEKFIPNPFEPPPARLYKTGDLARYFPDGNIEFLGRKDNQVKIRGFRIELGEIEAVLRQESSVQAAAVVAREDAHGGKRLVAYVVGRPPEPPDQTQVSAGAKAPVSNSPEPFKRDNSSTAPPSNLESKVEANERLITDLRDWLKSKLPEYMVPSIFVTLPELPLTPNGKLDRKALPAPDQVRPALTEGFVAPRNSTEEMLAGIWCEVLELDEVGINDNFFELGGHSLMAIQVISRVRETAQIELSMRDFFATPTIAALAAMIESILIEEISQLSDEQAQSLANTAQLGTP